MFGHEEDGWTTYARDTFRMSRCEGFSPGLLEMAFLLSTVGCLMETRQIINYPTESCWLATSR